MISAKNSSDSSPAPIRLKRREKVAYGIGDVANGIAVSSVAFWFLIYLTDVAGLPGTLAGSALMIGRAWDALVDPFVGWLSDRTNTRWGKRRPFLLFGALTYGLAFASIWMVPSFESETSRFLYVLVSFVIFNSSLALVFIPYTSLTASMTDDYNERVSLTGYRMTCSQIAFLIGGSIPPLLVAAFATSSGAGAMYFEALGLQNLFGTWAATPRQGYLLLGVTFGMVIIASTLAAFFGTRERIAPEGSHDGHEANPFKYLTGLVSVCKDNLAFRCSVMIKLLSTCATTLIGVNIPYYLTYVLRMPEQKTVVLGVLFISAILTTPLWVLAARRFGKAETFRFAMGGYVLVLLCILPLPSEPTNLIYPIAILAGIFHSAALLLPWSILPDVVEFDELQHGTRREGLLFGGSAFAYKFASALALFIVGVLLDLFGYIPNQAQTPTAVLGIKLTIALAPGLLFLASIWSSMSYPLSPERYREVLEELRERRTQRKDAAI